MTNRWEEDYAETNDDRKIVSAPSSLDFGELMKDIPSFILTVTQAEAAYTINPRELPFGQCDLEVFLTTLIAEFSVKIDRSSTSSEYVSSVLASSEGNGITSVSWTGSIYATAAPSIVASS
jgi:hypothetical protein